MVTWNLFGENVEIIIMKVVPTAEKDETEKSKEQSSNPKGKMNQEEGTLNLSLGIAYDLGQISIIPS